LKTMEGKKKIGPGAFPPQPDPQRRPGEPFQPVVDPRPPKNVNPAALQTWGPRLSKTALEFVPRNRGPFQAFAGGRKRALGLPHWPRPLICRSAILEEAENQRGRRQAKDDLRRDCLLWSAPWALERQAARQTIVGHACAGWANSVDWKGERSPRPGP